MHSPFNSVRTVASSATLPFITYCTNNFMLPALPPFLPMSHPVRPHHTSTQTFHPHKSRNVPSLCVLSYFPSFLTVFAVIWSDFVSLILSFAYKLIIRPLLSLFLYTKARSSFKNHIFNSNHIKTKMRNRYYYLLRIKIQYFTSYIFACEKGFPKFFINFWYSARSVININTGYAFTIFAFSDRNCFSCPSRWNFPCM